MDIDYQKIPTPKISFEEFYLKFNTVREVTETIEWKQTYQYYYSFKENELDIQIHESIDDIENYSNERKFKELTKCVNSFDYFCHKYVKIQHPLHGLIPFITFNYQKRVIKEYEQNRFNILSKFRQGGLTTVSTIWGLWRCMFQEDQIIMCMSKTDREAIDAGKKVKTAMDYLPEWLKPEMSKNNDHEKFYKDTGSTFYFYTPEAARSKSITWLIVDEAAFIQNMDEHWKAMYPILSTGGSCAIVSTVNGLGNWYEETYHSAERQENKFNIIDIDYWEHPVYNDSKWIEENRANLGPKGWQQEVMRSFLGSGETYIPAKIIDELDKQTRNNAPIRVGFEKWANPDSKITWDNGALWIWKEPYEGHEYLIAVDAAEGVGEDGDNSAFQILDIATLEQVAEFYSNNVPPHILSQIINQIAYFYNTALVVVENKSQGGAILSSLQHDLAYENIFFEMSGKRESPGVRTGPVNRPLILQSLQHRLLNGTININSRRLVSELKTFIFNAKSKRAEAQKGKHDDAIFALSLGIYIRDIQSRGIPVGSEVSPEMMEIFKTEVYQEIKDEIMNGSLEDWLEDDEPDPIFMPSSDDILSGVSFDIKRKNDKLLKEFGW